MNFATPWALALVPVVLLAAWWGAGRRRRGAVVFSSVELAELSGATWRTRLAWLPGALAALAMALLAVALARPRLGIGEVRTLANGVAIMMVLDRSASMALPLQFQGEDRPRLDVVKQVFSEFVEGNGGDLPGRPEDLIGLVAFARFAETVCPLVRVHGTLNKLVEGMQIADQQVEGGTAVGDGLALGAARLRQAEKDLGERNKGEQEPEFTIKSKVIVLLTDGDENAGEVRAADAARVCAQWGIKIYAIGVGDERGGVVDTPAGRITLAPGAGFDETVLRGVAEQTGGRYWRATDGEALRQAYAEIGKLETTEIRSKQYTSYREMFEPWAAAGAGLLAASMLLGSTWLRRGP